MKPQYKYNIDEIINTDPEKLNQIHLET